MDHPRSFATLGAVSILRWDLRVELGVRPVSVQRMCACGVRWRRKHS
jgi:hypothetical protein